MAMENLKRNSWFASSLLSFSLSHSLSLSWSLPLPLFIVLYIIMFNSENGKVQRFTQNTNFIWYKCTSSAENPNGSHPGRVLVAKSARRDLNSVCVSKVL